MRRKTLGIGAVVVLVLVAASAAAAIASGRVTPARSIEPRILQKRSIDAHSTTGPTAGSFNRSLSRL